MKLADERIYSVRSMATRTEMRRAEVEARLKMEKERPVFTAVERFEGEKQTAEIAVQKAREEVKGLEEAVEEEKRHLVGREKAAREVKTRLIAAEAHEDFQAVEALRKMEVERRREEREAVNAARELEGLREDSEALHEKYQALEDEMDAYYQAKIRQMEIYVHELRDK